ncbi:hypothetical protein Tco_1228294 [Tanacetum coccineum]
MTSLSDDDSPYGEDIDYVDASPPDVEIVSLEVVEIVDPEVERIDDDILSTIKDDTLREKLLNVNLLVAKIDALRDNPTPSSEIGVTLIMRVFADELTHIMSLPELECFKFKIESNPGDLDSIDLGIRKNVSTTNVNVPLEDDQSSLFAYVDCPDCDDSRCTTKFLSSDHSKLHILSFILGIQWLVISLHGSESRATGGFQTKNTGSYVVISLTRERGLGNGYSQKDEKQSQNGQKRARKQKELKSQKPGSKSQQKVNPDKVKVNQKKKMQT